LSLTYKATTPVRQGQDNDASLLTEGQMADPIIPGNGVVDRRVFIGALAMPVLLAMPSFANAATLGAAVTTGAASLVATGFASLAGKRIGLITNQTGRVGAEHIADLMRTAGNVKLTAILAPEHGFRGTAEAGASVRDGRDPQTGIPVYSLYGATKKPTPDMLRDVDILVFDIQDIGVRYYTYISTMGLAMQAAAAARLPFVVLDRPNPLGGVDVSGFTLERARTSFVGQYPIPIVHGLSVGELARMIKGERWLDGLDKLDLTVMPVRNWSRPMRWPETNLPWVATSPNIPTFESALVYPGIGIVGEALVNEGRGTPTPFSQFGAPWLDAAAASRHLNGLDLPGVRFEAVKYTPLSIPNVAAKPRFEGQQINAVRLAITDVASYHPLEVGIHALVHLQREAKARGIALFETYKMFHSISGTARLQQMLDSGASGATIIASWQNEVRRFNALRGRYLMY
jgi:uncharacterized protein YbbC (DUF1343 family)